MYPISHVVVATFGEFVSLPEIGRFRYTQSGGPECVAIKRVNELMHVLANGGDWQQHSVVGPLYTCTMHLSLHRGQSQKGNAVLINISIHWTLLCYIYITPRRSTLASRRSV